MNPRAPNRVHTIFSQVDGGDGAALVQRSEPAEHPRAHRDSDTEVRRAFVARDCGDDPILLSIDYSQIELRILAHMSGDEAASTRHSPTARGHPRARRPRRCSAVDPADVRSRRIMRRHAKVFNFGVLYGLTAFGLSQREGVDFDEANAFIEAYFEAYPKVQEWRERTVEETRTKGYAETLTGRRRPIPDLYASNRNRRQAAERIAINMPIQGTASDIIKIAMNGIDRELLERRQAGQQARMVLQVHDELIFELPRAELDDVREVAHRLMPSLELAVALDLDEKLGVCWGDLE